MNPVHDRRGLTPQQVAESAQQHGINLITPPKKQSLLVLYLKKLRDPLIIILIIACIASCCMAYYEYHVLGEGKTVFFEPIGIFLAIFLATGLAFVFEHKANKEFDLLNQVNDEELVQVMRDGNVCQIPKKEVVVGDLILLDTGNEVPADALILQATGLKVDESTLTGEPLCEKTDNTNELDEHATFPSNHVLRGTKVLEGHALAEVFAVGDATENGKVFRSVSIGNKIKTPLDQQMERLGKLITRFSFIIAGLVILVRILSWFLSHSAGTSAPVDESFILHMLQTVMMAVTIIVVSVPEGLPMAVTLSLAYSMRRMMSTQNLVRSLHACETMGAITVICTDKTGTLTQNRMSVSQALFFGRQDPDLSTDPDALIINESIAVNSTAKLDLQDPQNPQPVGNPTEGSLLLWLHRNGVDYKAIKAQVEVISELPFSTKHKYMASFVRSASGRRMLYVKGAPEIIMRMCSHYAEGMERETVTTRLHGYQNQAMRTLAFAIMPIEDGVPDPIHDGTIHVDRLTLVGITAIADPVRKEVPDAINQCNRAGIHVKIVTGDTNATATEIARQIGLWNDDVDNEQNIITGPDFEALSDQELRARINQIKIISRARPLDKKRLVETLQDMGQVVAVTGDGTNDAPALKAAHVGLSMGDGTSVAKEASDITIIDSSFASISRAVMWGRSLYQNIQRFLLFQLTVNLSACLLVMCGTLMGFDLPLTVTQMLWVNLIMDTFGAMALSSLPPSPAVMNASPRCREDFIITAPMKRRIIAVGIVFFIAMASLLFIFEHGEVYHLTDLANYKMTPRNGLNAYEQTYIFCIFVVANVWNLLNVRAFASTKSVFDLKGCKGLLSILLVIIIGQLCIVHLLYPFFEVTPITLTDWLIIIIGTSPMLLVSEVFRKKRPMVQA